MSKKDLNLPDCLFVGRKHKQKYVLTVFLVATRKADGTPDVVKRIADDEEVTLKGGEEFITAYIPAVVLKQK